MKIKIFIVLIILAVLSPISFNLVKNGVFAQTAPALQNDKLPEFIEWAKTYDIKLIGTKRSGQYIENNIWNSAADEIPLTAIGGINSVFEDLKKIPSHLINTLRGNAIFFSSGSNNCVDRAGFFLYQTELSQKYQKKPSELPQEAREEGRRTYISAGILPYMGNDGFYIRPYDIFLCMPGPATVHEFGHIVDLNGIRMFNGRETAIGKSDEETRQLYVEYERIFGVNKLSPEIRQQWQNSTSTMPGILNNYGLNGDDENFAVSFDYYVSRAQYFRDKASQDPGVAEKYEFLKNKIFLAPTPVSTPTITTPTQTSSAQIEALKTQIQALQDQIAKFQAQLNEIQKTESKTTSTPVATPAQTNVFIKTLQRGIKDAEVTKLQEFLRQYPEIYPEGLVTGYFGFLTEAAVKKFQEKYSIESIGIVGPKTRQKLNELISGQPPLIFQPIGPTSPEESVKPDSSPVPTPIPTPVPILTPKPTQPETQCPDGTLYDQCSTIKPIQCSDGILKANCQVCGCGFGFYCQLSGNCARVISLVPPANWTDELRKEWNDNLEEVHRVAEGIQQWNWNWESLHNEDLPKLIQWGAEHSLIKLVYGGAFASEKAPKVTIPGVNAVFEALSAMPPHLVKMLESGAGGTLYLANRFENCGNQAGCYSSGAFYITICPSGTGDMHTTAHELGHIVDCVGIRNAKGNEFSFGKTDEEINDLRKEYERIFQPSSNPSSDYALKEAFAGWFSDYITPDYLQRFRKEATQDPRIAEKYEFLKTKIFLGKEY